jgi:hypothetical protein
MLGVKSVPIQFGIDGKRRWLHIKDLLELQIQGEEGAEPNHPCVVNSAFGVVPGSDLVVARF